MLAGNPVSAVPGQLRAALAGGLELVEALVAEAAHADNPGEAPVDIAGARVVAGIEPPCPCVTACARPRTRATRASRPSTLPMCLCLLV